GDALLALWKVERKELSEAITLAVKCSLNIQKCCDNRDTDVGVNLRVKIGISAGKLSKVVLGDEQSEYFVVIGRAVDEVRLAEGLALANTVILSPNAWEMCDRKNIVTTKIENERAVKVRHPSPNKYSKAIMNCLSTQHSYFSQQHKALLRATRKASSLLPKAALESTLRKYIMDTVLQKIDDDQPLEYLSEMRPATIVFINLQFREDATINQQCISMQDACISIHAFLRKKRGRVNKVFMFDKGCTFLSAFGLPGDKVEDECVHALQSAFKIHSFCSENLIKLRVASVGITTGLVFCGVVGHPLRHEYTEVIGRKVNMAARLMMHYPGVVSCDVDTFRQSQLSSHCFSELPKQSMKGVQNPGPIYQYLGKNREKKLVKPQLSVEREDDYPLLGREQELEAFMKALKQFIKCKGIASNNYQNVVMYEGVFGLGKSKLLAEIVHRSQKNGLSYRVIAFSPTKADVRQPFFSVQTMVAGLLHLHNCKGYAEREKVISSKINDPAQQELLCLLNPLLLVKFPVSQKVSLMSSHAKVDEMKNFIFKIINKEIRTETVMFVIDQAHNIDIASWGFITEMLNKTATFVVMALLPFTIENPPCHLAVDIMQSSQTLHLKLMGLDPSVIPELACSILGVIRIPKELEIFLIERSYGVPYFCEQLLKSLYFSNFIVLEELENDEDEIRHWAFCYKNSTPETKLKCLAITSVRWLYVCTINEGVKLQNIPIPPTLKGMALAKLDNMHPAEQMVVKCAAVIGHTFHVKMLQYILPEGSYRKLKQSLATLLGCGMFECASKQADMWHILTRKNLTFKISSPMLALPPSRKFSCRLNFEESQAVLKCKVMRFCTAFVQETAYELWLKDQKKALHLKCTKFLEERAQKCYSCGGGNFIYAHLAVTIMLNATTKQIMQHMINTHQLSPELRLFLIPALSSQIHDRLWQEVDEGIETFDIDTNVVAKKSSFIDKLDELFGKCEENFCLPSSNCECGEVINSVMSGLARHWMAVGNVEKAVYYLLETAAGALYLSNTFMALSYLIEATSVLKSVKEKNFAFGTDKFEKACLFSLKGEVHFHMGEMSKAQFLLRKALKLLNRRLPQSIFEIPFKYLYEKVKYFIHHKYSSASLFEPYEKRIAYIHEQIRCLSFIWQIYSMKTSPMYIFSSSVAILMERNCAELSQNENKTLYIYILISAHHSLNKNQGFRIFYLYLNFLFIFNRIVKQTNKQLSYTKLNLCHLYMSNFVRLELKISKCYRSHRIAVLLDKPNLDFIVIPILAKSLFLSNRYNESSEMLLCLEELANRNHSTIAKAWFYVDCLDILLQGGFAVKSFEECLDFTDQLQTNPVLMAENTLMLSLYSSLALWFARLKQWEFFNPVFKKVRKLADQANASFSSMNGYIKFLECKVLLLKKAVIENNSNAVDILKKVNKLLDDLKRRCTTSPVYYSRLFHLKAYVYMLLGQKKMGQLFIKKALTICQTHGNKLEESWIMLSKEAWSSESCQLEDLWLQTALTMPSWKMLEGMDMDKLYQTKYILQVPTSEEMD
uniref:Guanylate cyclase domain-containing protein n=1 Tax=Latimeria chalumnae TaxID=7897 RepID=H3AB06_LATCH